MAWDRTYKFFRPWVEFATRCHYASVTIRGTERLPREGGYIIAPCHQNALMEPLLILLLTPRPVYHICRGDIFAHPAVARFLTFLKIFPIFRRRDGLSTLGRNQETFRRSQEVLVEGFPLSMMAEGQHTDRHQLLPLVKGMFRIAGETQRELGDKPLYIVPLGIDLDDYERPYSHAVLNVGEPIDVRPFMTTFENDEPVALNAMRDALTSALKAAMHNIDSRTHYPQFEALCDLLNREERQRQGLADTPYNRFLMRQSIAHRLDALETTVSNTPDAPEAQKLERLLHYADERMAYCRQHHRRLKSVAEPVSPCARLLRYAAIAAVIGAAVCLRPVRWLLLACLVAYPIPLIPTHLWVRRWVSDTQFRSSVNFGVRLLLSLIYGIVMFVVVACLQGLLWACGALLLFVVLARVSGPLLAWLRQGLA